MEAGNSIQREESTTSHTYAGFWIRLAATMIDVFIIGTLYIILFIGILSLNHGISFLSFVLVIPFQVLYFWLFTGKSGQTIGKKLVHIKVVGGNNQVPDYSKVFVRKVVGKLVSYLTFYIGFLWIACDKQKQDLHDKISETHVVKI